METELGFLVSRNASDTFLMGVDNGENVSEDSSARSSLAEDPRKNETAHVVKRWGGKICVGKHRTVMV